MYIEKSYPEFGIRKVSMAIGGSDGPTSIFLVGNKQKEKNLITRLLFIVLSEVRLKKLLYHFYSSLRRRIPVL